MGAGAEFEEGMSSDFEEAQLSQRGLERAKEIADRIAGRVDPNDREAVKAAIAEESPRAIPPWLMALLIQAVIEWLKRRQQGSEPQV